MYTLNFEEDLQHEELLEFLLKVDNYFTKSLHSTCKQPSLSAWAELLLTKASFLVARDNVSSEIIGMLIFYKNNPGEFVYVSIAVVLKQYQNQHIASAMLIRLFDECKHLNRAGIHLHTHCVNTKALACYTKIGFREKNEDMHVDQVSLYWTLNN